MLTGRRRAGDGVLRGALLVFVGGCLGAGAREVLTVILPDQDPVPVAILIANLAGALLLGLLLESLIARRDSGADRIRLLIGTGGLGGFTTYSALALAVARLAAEGTPGLAAAYGLGTLGAGALATWAGILLGGALRRRSAGSRSAASRVAAAETAAPAEGGERDA